MARTPLQNKSVVSKEGRGNKKFRVFSCLLMSIEDALWHFYMGDAWIVLQKLND